MTKPTTIAGLELPITPDTVIPLSAPLSPRQPRRVCDLPAIMGEEGDWFNAYRHALIQFVADWNRSDDPASLIAEPPTYEGTGWRILPTIASLVHALAARKTLPMPAWVWENKASQDWVVFGDPPSSYFWQRALRKAPATCVHHRIYFHPRLLDKGTPDWWLPWD
ncbi:MAG: hypothetical protein OXC98_00165 [bacterium]|nr:hypothetical protein [Acidimicrobiia bacterium]MCY4648775.1 hypothetical protein [bacterium]